MAAAFDAVAIGGGHQVEWSSSGGQRVIVGVGRCEKVEATMLAKLSAGQKARGGVLGLAVARHVPLAMGLAGAVRSSMLATSIRPGNKSLRGGDGRHGGTEGRRRRRLGTGRERTGDEAGPWRQLAEDLTRHGNKMPV